ncbi:MAG: UPF0175 family protein [Desulfonauticus sp.]|nr:UPF0175 family protein [Desulfonauticus sp.]
MMQSSIRIPEFIFHASHLTPGEVFLELAVVLYEKKKITLGQASELCNLSQLKFQHILASRDICIHFDKKDFKKDLKTLKSLGLL